MRRLPLLVAVLTSLVAAVLLAPPASAASTLALPSSIASTGDSITRAYDATLWGCFLADCPQYSWSTGTSGSVNSQYRRILAQNAAVNGHVYNDAKTGAKMSVLAGQMGTAAGQGAQYVTVLMGANDLCTSSAATMTSVADFRSQFQSALTTYFGKAPAGAHVFVSSIPNLYQLWSLFQSNSSAKNTWSTFGICQSMLSAKNTATQRQAVVDREAQFNQALAEVCTSFADSCRFDGMATFNTVFVRSDVSTVDYFHPSVSGQNKLAGISWAASYWG